MGIAKVTFVRRSSMDFVLVQRIFYLVREDTGGETRDDLLGTSLVSTLQDIVVDQEIVSQEGKLYRARMRFRLSQEKESNSPCISCS